MLHALERDHVGGAVISEDIRKHGADPARKPSKFSSYYG
jgi:hypothetical protein